MKKEFEREHDKLLNLTQKPKNDHDAQAIQLILEKIFTILKTFKNPEIEKIIEEIDVQKKLLYINSGPSPEKQKDKRIVNDDVKNIHFKIELLLDEVYNYI